MTNPNRRVEPLGKVHTKIVATLGPASREAPVVRGLIEAGADLVRLNFSQGTPEEHGETLRAVAAVAGELERPIGVLVDLGGPKVRLGPIPGDAVDAPLGEVFTLVNDRRSDDPRELTSTYRELVRDLSPDDPVLFDDGAVAMKVAEVGASWAKLEVTRPGRLRSRKGINVPETRLRVQALTVKDLDDLDWLAEHPVDYVGLSFIRSPEDVTWLRRELNARNMAARVVAKIEKAQAVEHLDAILAEADAAMVARGDLGVEVDVATVPAIQKRVIAACHTLRIPVITATQMLASMEGSPQPTRAEASDVFNAVLDGTDAVMLSGETAIGSYPVEAVATMSRIAAEAEKLMPSGRVVDPGRPGLVSPITEGMVEAASLASRRLEASLLVVASHSGRTALALSAHRHATPTLALTDKPEVARAMTLYWGVTPMIVPDLIDGEQAMMLALDWARARGLIAAGDRVVLVRGTVPGSAVHNALLVQEVR